MELVKFQGDHMMVIIRHLGLSFPTPQNNDNCDNDDEDEQDNDDDDDRFVISFLLFLSRVAVRCAST